MTYAQLKHARRIADTCRGVDILVAMGQAKTRKTLQFLTFALNLKCDDRFR